MKRLKKIIFSFFSLAVLGLFFGGCDTMNEKKELTYKFAEYFSQKDAQAIGTLLDDNFALYDPKLKWVRGKQAVVDVLEKGFKDTKNALYKIVHYYQAGETTIVEFQITMDDAQFNGVDFIEWKGNKMSLLRCYYNPPEEEE